MNDLIYIKKIGLGSDPESNDFFDIEHDMIKNILINGLTPNEYFDTAFDDIRSFTLEYEDLNQRFYASDEENKVVNTIDKTSYHKVRFELSDGEVIIRNLDWHSHYPQGFHFLQRIGKTKDNLYYFYHDIDSSESDLFNSRDLEGMLKSDLNKPLNYRLKEEDLEDVKVLYLTIENTSVFEAYDDIKEDINLLHNLHHLTIALDNDFYEDDVDITHLKNLPNLTKLVLYTRFTKFLGIDELLESNKDLQVYLNGEFYIEDSDFVPEMLERHLMMEKLKKIINKD